MLRLIEQSVGENITFVPYVPGSKISKKVQS